jgi:hypothetical protein
VINLKGKRGRVKNPGRRRILLPSEGFKGNLAVPLRAAAAISAGGWDGEASVQGESLHFLCRDIPSLQFEPNSSSPRQTYEPIVER